MVFRTFNNHAEINIAGHIQNEEYKILISTGYLHMHCVCVSEIERERERV